MYRGLLKTLTYIYQFVTLGRDQLSAAELNDMAAAANTMAGKAPGILDAEDGTDAKTNKLDLAQAEIVEGHIEEMVAWITHLEII